MNRQRVNYPGNTVLTVVSVNGRDFFAQGSISDPTFEEGAVENLREYTTPADQDVNVFETNSENQIFESRTKTPFVEVFGEILPLRPVGL